MKNLGKPVSHGCVRIAPDNATALYALVKTNGLENTQVVLAGLLRAANLSTQEIQTGPGWGYFEPPFGGTTYYSGPEATTDGRRVLTVVKAGDVSSVALWTGCKLPSARPALQ